MTIIQTLLINIILATIIAHIMKRNLGSDIERFNEVALPSLHLLQALARENRRFR